MPEARPLCGRVHHARHRLHHEGGRRRFRVPRHGAQRQLVRDRAALLGSIEAAGVRRSSPGSCPTATTTSPALDAGADSIVIPMVGSADQARSVVAKMKYTPVGKRGLALALANDRYRMQPVAEALAAANARTRFVALIETAEGVENVEEIAAVDGVDVLWVGASDLTASMGIPGQFDHPDYKKALAKVLKAGQKHGLGLGRMVGDIPSGVGLAEEGWEPDRL
ncbi:MAG: aldolase/citrate lyase family protein [Geminicoccaceae bacterium]